MPIATDLLILIPEFKCLPCIPHGHEWTIDYFLISKFRFDLKNTPGLQFPVFETLQKKKNIVEGRPSSCNFEQNCTTKYSKLTK